MLSLPNFCRPSQRIKKLFGWGDSQVGTDLWFGGTASLSQEEIKQPVGM